MGIFFEIKILGTSIKINVEEDAAYIKQVVDHLENAVKDVENATGITDPLKIAILTSINLIDDLYKEKKTNIGKEVSDLTEKMIGSIEDVL